MLLRRMIDHIKAQNWTAVTLDFVIVVVGVFVGVQATGWANERAEQQQIRTYLQTLKEDLINDRDMLEIVSMQINRDIIGKTAALTEYSRNRSLEDYDNLELLILKPGLYRPYAWNRTTLSQLQAIGGIRQIKDVRLRSMIADYEAMTDHLDLDFRVDAQRFDALHNLSYAIIDHNYSSYDALIDLSSEDLTTIRSSGAYKQARKENLTYLAKSEADLRGLISGYVAYARDMHPTVKREIPEVIEKGSAIVEQIDQKYE